MNSDSQYGMAFGASQQALQNAPQYTTNQTRLQMDLNNPTGKLFDLVDIPCGTDLVASLNVAANNEETLATIEHGLGYTPQVFITFFRYNVGQDTSYTNPNNFYTIEQLVLAAGGAGTDYVGYDINDETLTILHNNQSYGLGTGTYTSTAGLYRLKVKYLICNNQQIHVPNFQ